MRDDDCVRLLQWALPRLHMRWPGFRKVRKQVCKRISRRLAQLQLSDGEAYREYLEQHAEEWPILDGLCRVVVTRYYRDKLVFARLTEQVVPELARTAAASGRDQLRCWCIGSASGEEPYTLAILWHEWLAPRLPDVTMRILATEVNPHLLERARQACYSFGSIRNLPSELRGKAFETRYDRYCLRADYQALVEFSQQDIRTDVPEGPFDLILCRNLVFTYFDQDLEVRILKQLLAQLRPGGWLLLGVRESLPETCDELVTVSERLGIYRRRN